MWQPFVTRAQLDVVKGRWISRDPIGFAGGINLYGYVGNNPIIGLDPWGTADPTTLWGQLADPDTWGYGLETGREALFSGLSLGLYQPAPSIQNRPGYSAARGLGMVATGALIAAVAIPFAGGAAVASGALTNLATGYVTNRVFAQSWSVEQGATDVITGMMGVAALKFASLSLKALYNVYRTTRAGRLYIWFPPFNEELFYGTRKFPWHPTWASQWPKKPWWDPHGTFIYGGRQNIWPKLDWARKAAEVPEPLSPIVAGKFSPHFPLNPFFWWKGFAGQYSYVPEGLPTIARDAYDVMWPTGYVSILTHWAQIQLDPCP